MREAAKKFETAGIGLRKEWSVEGSETLYAEMRVLSTSNPLIIFFVCKLACSFLSYRYCAFSLDISLSPNSGHFYQKYRSFHIVPSKKKMVLLFFLACE